MTIDNITAATTVTTYSHETMSKQSFADFLANPDTELRMYPAARYDRVEYMNSPFGLIVLAHHGDIAGQIDGIHPKAISESITGPRNIIEPFTRSETLPDYNVHYMTRRSQGGLVLAAFGRMIDSGDPLAPSISTERNLKLEVYNTPAGPVVILLEPGSNFVWAIKPTEVEAQEAALLEDGEPPRIPVEPEFIDMTAEDEASIREPA